MGIGLPKWLFDGDSRTAPLLLAALVFGGVLLPLGAAACYLLSSNKYNADGVVEESYHNFLMCAAPHTPAVAVADPQRRSCEWRAEVPAWSCSQRANTPGWGRHGRGRLVDCLRH